MRVVQANHPRDDHSGYTPFDPQHHLSSVGENLQGWPFRANAMEVVNAGAMNSFPMQLVHDWLGLLTRGLRVAGIGSTDTHTVSFVPVGQARTYIGTHRIGHGWRERPGDLMTEIAEGNNLVSYGLATELELLDTAVRSERQRVPVSLTVWGPSWSVADRVTIFSNGIPVWEHKLKGGRNGGKKFSAVVEVAVPGHDTDLVAVATGPGINEPFWEVVQPGRPTSDEHTPMILGISRVVRLDADGDGNQRSPLRAASYNSAPP